MVIFIEFFGSLMLITGSFTRVAALGVFGLFIGILFNTHPSFFFMNWGGEQRSEGLEYHLLILGMSLALLIGGGGSLSLDSKLIRNNK
jgi:putative oxidoreductase